jgi:hypothetical protein
MNTVEKYLDALEAAVEAKDKEAITLLESFATHLYKEINTRTDAASGEERVEWDRLLQRVKVIISGMAKHGPDLW